MHKARAIGGILLVMFGSACASSRSDDGIPEMGLGTRPTVVSTATGVTGSVSAMTISTRTDVNRTLISYPVAKTFQALELAYAQLQIGITERDPKQFTLGNSAFRARRRVGDVQAVRAFDCGGDSGMPNAETYQLVITIQSRLTPSETGGSILSTLVEATGRNPAQGGTSDVQCSSNGGLEKRIAELTQEKLKGM